MNKIIYVALLLMLCSSNSIILAQSNKTFFLGHSLINFDIPNMVDKLSISSNEPFIYEANIGIGATLDWHISHPETGQGDQWNLTLPQGGYEHFILTEAVPLENHLQFSNTYRNTDSLYRFALEDNPNIQYYIYETWHCTNSGNGSTSGSGGNPCDWDPNSNTVWRERIDNDLSRWESIADSINLNHTNPMLVISGGQALGRLDDAIRDGEVPELSSVFDLFVDEYHLDSRGNYFIACVMFAVIHKTSPVGLPNQLTNQFGILYTDYPTPDQAAIMQELAWQTVCEYQRSGANCETVSLPKVVKEEPTINIYPVPVNGVLTVECDAYLEGTPYLLYNYMGEVMQRGLLQGKRTSINVSEIPEGLYLIKINDQTLNFLK